MILLSAQPCHLANLYKPQPASARLVRGAQDEKSKFFKSIRERSEACGERPQGPRHFADDAHFASACLVRVRAQISIREPNRTNPIGCSKNS